MLNSAFCCTYTQTPCVGLGAPKWFYPLHRMYPPRKVLHVHSVVELVGTWFRLCREIRNCLLFVTALKKKNVQKSPSGVCAHLLLTFWLFILFSSPVAPQMSGWLEPFSQLLLFCPGITEPLCPVKSQSLLFLWILIVLIYLFLVLCRTGVA